MDANDPHTDEDDIFWKMLEEACKNANNEFWNRSQKDCGTCKKCGTCNLCQHYSLLNGFCNKHGVPHAAKDTCSDWLEDK
jgi:hypothetical protein